MLIALVFAGVGVLTWTFALQKVALTSGSLPSVSIVKIAGTTGVIVCVFALDNAITLQLGETTKRAVEYTVVLAAICLSFVANTAAISFGIRGGCSLLSAVASGMQIDAEGIEQAKRVTVDKLMGLLTLLFSFLLALSTTKSVTVAVQPLLTNGDSDTVVSWTMFSLFLVMSLLFLVMSSLFLAVFSLFLTIS